MDAQTCILTRRSVRTFTQKAIDHDLLEKVISLAAYAPSWKNTQISRYIAIEDPSVKQNIIDRFCLPNSNNPAIIRPFLSAIIQAKSQGITIDTNVVGELAKYLNLLGGTYILDCLPEQRIYDKTLDRIMELHTLAS